MSLCHIVCICVYENLDQMYVTSGLPAVAELIWYIYSWTVRSLQLVLSEYTFTALGSGFEHLVL